MSSMQSVGLNDRYDEQEIKVAGPGEGRRRPYSSLRAAAVTLESGDILVTGGMRREREVFLVSGTDLSQWSRRQDMLEPRMGHASARVVLGRQEKVLAVGGWDKRGQVQPSTEMYTPGRYDICDPYKQMTVLL